MSYRVSFAALCLTIATAAGPGFSQTPRPQQPRAAQPRAAQRTAKPQPLTLRQVLESISANKSSRRAEDLVSKNGVQFQATPAILDILKQYGASTKLIGMIPAPPPPPPAPQPPKPRIAGPFTVVCEPRDCSIIVDEKFHGATDANRKTLEGLPAGEVNVQVRADGYDPLSRRVRLDEGKAVEEKFSLAPSVAAREEAARELLLRTMVRLGGLDGMAELEDIESSGTLQWMTASGSTEQWSATINRRPGRNLSATFKTSDGQCTASIASQTTKKECRGDLRNGGDRIAEQAASLFLSYQIQDVIDTLLRRPLTVSPAGGSLLESADGKDSYTLSLGEDGLPNDLIYKIGDTDAPVRVQYANYVDLGKGRFPGKISIGRPNSAPAWVFMLNNVRARSGRNE
jgi:hypothetical protein